MISVLPCFRWILIVSLTSFIIIACSKSENGNPSEPPASDTTSSSNKKNWRLDSTFVHTGTYVTMAAVQTDGKIIIGNPTSIGRINKNGSRDDTFPLLSAFGGEIKSICLQPDGKLVVGGSFTGLNSFNRKGLVRLNSNGTIDENFNSADIIDGEVRCVTMQGANRILVCGKFIFGYSADRKYAYANLACIKTNGEIDQTFNHYSYFVGTATLSFNDFSYVKVVHDENIYITGKSVSLSRGGKECRNVVKFSKDGLLDTSFCTNTGSLSYAVDPSVGYGTIVGANVLEVLNDGKVLVGGDFNNVGKEVWYCLIWLNPDGTLNTSVKEYGHGNVYSVCIMPENSFFLGEVFKNDRRSNSGGGFGLLKPDGEIDNSYDLSYPRGGDIYGIVKESDNSVLVMGKLYVGMQNGENIYKGMARIIRN